jgi:hypothetical protein
MNIVAAIFLLAWASTSTAAVAVPCPLPTTYQWKDNGMLVMPRINGTILQDFTHVPLLHAHLVYASYIRSGKAGFITFGLLPQLNDMASAVQTQLNQAVILQKQIHSDNVLAATLFFFRPKSIWVLAYQSLSQSERYPFSMMLSKNPTDPTSWYND